MPLGFAVASAGDGVCCHGKKAANFSPLTPLDSVTDDAKIFGRYCGKNFNGMQVQSGEAATVDACKFAIRAYLKQCSIRQEAIWLYYTGHGATGTGDWCFHGDGKLTFDDLVESLQEYPQKYVPTIFCDCCYSGRWPIKAASLYNKGGLQLTIKTACAPDAMAEETHYALAAFCGVPDSIHQIWKAQRSLEHWNDGKVSDFCDGQEMRKWKV